MADFEGEEQDGEASPGRDRALTSPASPTRDGGGQTHGAGVGAARQGSRNATIGVSSGVQTDGADDGGYGDQSGFGGRVVDATPSGEVRIRYRDRGSLRSGRDDWVYQGVESAVRRSLGSELIEEEPPSHWGKDRQLKRIRNEIEGLEREIALRRDELGLMGAECELENARTRARDYGYSFSGGGMRLVDPREGIIVGDQEYDVGGERGRGYGRGRDPPEELDARPKRFAESESAKNDSRSRSPR